jgi:hypothetical protein
VVSLLVQKVCFYLFFYLSISVSGICDTLMGYALFHQKQLSRIILDNNSDVARARNVLQVSFLYASLVAHVFTFCCRIGSRN